MSTIEKIAILGSLAAVGLTSVYFLAFKKSGFS